MSEKTGELVLYEGSNASLVVSRPPKLVIEEARQAAAQLMDIMKQKPKKVMMGDEQYLEFEDWQTVAKFYNATVKVRVTNFVQFGAVQGFEAIADVLDANGCVISSADSMCLNDEEKWGMRNKYEWKDILDANGKKIWVEATAPEKAKGKKGHYKAEKVLASQEPVPLFQLRSMAQTRACAKALRNVFSWVVVLAGYKTTPAEELEEGQTEPEDETGAATGTQGGTTTQGHTSGVGAGENAATGQEGGEKPRPMTEGMTKMMHGKLKGLGIATDETKKAYISELLKRPLIESFDDIGFDDGRKLIDLLVAEAKKIEDGK